MPAEARPPWRIGLVAHLDDGGSAHTQTFERALRWGLVRGGMRGPLVELHRACDGARGDRAEAVAQGFVAARVDVVVGHFASAAAARAAPVYAAAGVPLLLPAATAPALTRHANVFRLCAHDDAIRAAAVQHLATQRDWRRLCVRHDGGGAAAALAQALGTAARGIDTIELVAHPGAAEALFYVGRQHAAAAALGALGADLPQHLMLSDDALHPAMAAALAALGREALAFGLDAAPGAPTYFAETCAALQIALALQAQPGPDRPAALRHGAWPTVLGTVRFAAGENPDARVATWRLGARGIERLRPEPEPLAMV